MPILTCQRCGKPFEAATKRGRYCPGPCFCAQELEAGRRRAAKFSPERRRASTLVQTELYHGRLVRQPCEVCGTTVRVDAHHDDYAKPLEVRWLCKGHHKQHHHRVGPGLNAFVEAAS